MRRISLEKPGSPGSRLRKPLLSAAAFILLATMVVLAQLPALVGALVARGLQDDPVPAKLAGHIQGHKADLTRYVQRFNGRSLFNKPTAPRPTNTQVIKPPEPVVKHEPAAPGPPASYNGPAVTFVLGDQVWFKNGMTLSVGEESNGVKVIAADPPWKVTLSHGGGTYDVELFKRIDLFADNKPSAQRDFPGLKAAPQNAPVAAPARQNEASP